MNIIQRQKKLILFGHDAWRMPTNEVVKSAVLIYGCVGTENDNQND